jgi:hypothetical protein
MQRLFWRIAGADFSILEKSGNESQRSFWIIGVLYSFINTLIFIGFFGLFFGVFQNFIFGLIGTVVLGFLISNIYRINLMSLEPHTLPIKKEPDAIALILTKTIRYTTVITFAFFVSKCNEMIFVNFLENLDFVKYGGSHDYIDHMAQINKEHPWVWIITIITTGIFCLPIYLRQRLNNKAHEYYAIKKRRDIQLVNDQYKSYTIEKTNIYRRVYSEYSKVNEFKTYVMPFSKYSNEPFNTKEIKENISIKSSYDFSHLEDWK